MSDQSVTFRVSLRFSELYSANIRATARKLRWVFYIWAAASVVLIVLLVFANFDSVFPLAVPVIVGGGVAVIFFPLMNLITPFSRYRHPQNREGITYTIAADGVHLEGPGLKADTPWGRILRSRETPNAFYLYLGPYRFYLLPKRCIANGNDAAALREILRAHFPNEKSLLTA